MWSGAWHVIIATTIMAGRARRPSERASILFPVARVSLKTTLHLAIARLIHALGLTDPRARSEGLFTVVTFHRVLPAADRSRYPFPGLAVTPAELDAILAFLVRHFDCGTLARQADRYAVGEPAAKPLLAVTFDDAQHDNFAHARPVLARHGVLASFFAPVVAVESREPLWHDRLGFAVQALLADEAGGPRRLTQILADAGLPAALAGKEPIHEVAQASKHLTLDERLRFVSRLAEAAGQRSVPAYARMMTVEELAALADEGHEVGSHSMTHCLMTECDDESLHWELAESRRRLETALDRPVSSFCYPNGNCDERTARAVAAAGYRRAVTTRWGHNDRSTDLFQLNRFDMESAYLTDTKGDISPARLAFRLSGLRKVA